MVFRIRDVDAEEREDRLDEYAEERTPLDQSSRERQIIYSDSSKNLNNHSTRRQYEHRKGMLLKRDQKNKLFRSVGSFR